MEISQQWNKIMCDQSIHSNTHLWHIHLVYSLSGFHRLQSLVLILYTVESWVTWFVLEFVKLITNMPTSFLARSIQPIWSTMSVSREEGGRQNRCSRHWCKMVSVVRGESFKATATWPSATTTLLEITIVSLQKIYYDIYSFLNLLFRNNWRGFTNESQK